MLDFLGTICQGGAENTLLESICQGFFRKKYHLFFWLVFGGKLEGRFKICYKQILNHVANFFNLYFQIFLTQFQEKCNTFFQFLLHYFLLSVKKKITLILLDFFNHFDIIYIRITENALKNIGRGRGDNLNFGYENKNDIKELEKFTLYKM